MRRVRHTRIVSGQIRSGRHWEGTPDEESRQEYATGRIQQLQEHFADMGTPLTFEVLRQSFATYGEFYDQGYRLTDGRAAA